MPGGTTEEPIEERHGSLYIRNRDLETRTGAERHEDAARGMVHETVARLAAHELDLVLGEGTRREPGPHATVDLGRLGVRAHERP